MAMQHRGWITGLGRACQEPWRRFFRAESSAATQLTATNAVEQAENDATFLQALSQSFTPSAAAESRPSSCRPLLATLPAAAELMELATVPDPSPQPLYDLPTFLEVSYPQASVRPRNPAYDWHRWAQNHAASASKAHFASPNTSLREVSQEQQHLEGRLALLRQVDAHMQLPASRQALLRIAKLELAHLWHYQQQMSVACAHGEASNRGSASGAEALEQVASASSDGNGEARTDGERSSRQGDEGSSEGITRPPGGEAPPSATASPSAASAAGDGAVGGVDAGVDEDDIFMAADRKARARAQQQQRELMQREQLGLRQEEQQQLAAQGTASGDPMLGLPTDLQLRLRELQRRAEAYGQPRGGSLPDVLRSVAEAFEQRISYGRGGHSAAAAGGAEGGPSPAAVAKMALSVGAGSAHRLGRRQLASPADLQLQPLMQQKDTAAMSYWAEHPFLSYGDNVVALAVRQNAARRSELAGGPDGKHSLAAAVASLSASIPRPPIAATGNGASVPPRVGPPAPPTPVLSLLLELLQLKYMDLLHAWEVAARLRNATGCVERAAAQQRATMVVQVGDQLPAALREELSNSWGNAAAAFRPEVLAPMLQPHGGGGAGSATPAYTEAQPKAAQRALSSPLDWDSAADVLKSVGCADAAAAAAAGGDLRAAVRHALEPVLAAAAARHQALLAGANPPAAATASTSNAGAVSAAASPAANVVCFRETLVLDASSAFSDASHDCRVTLEFDVDRLAASEPALGGAWGARLMERLLAPPSILSPGDPYRRRSAPVGSMAGRARRGAAARSALMALAYPVDIERRFCRRTRTASLTTCRYPNREANRKLLLETYTEVLAMVARAASGGMTEERGRSEGISSVSAAAQ